MKVLYEEPKEKGDYRWIDNDGSINIWHKEEKRLNL